MLKRKRIKGQITIYKTQDRSLKIGQHYPTKKTRDEFRCSTSSRNNSGVLRAPERIQMFYKLQKEFRARRTPEFFLELVEHLNSFWSS
jgi:hypothetical protein